MLIYTCVSTCVWNLVSAHEVGIGRLQHNHFFWHHQWKYGRHTSKHKKIPCTVTNTHRHIYKHLQKQKKIEHNAMKDWFSQGKNTLLIPACGCIFYLWRVYICFSGREKGFLWISWNTKLLVISILRFTWNTTICFVAPY